MGYGVMIEGFKLRGRISHKFSASPSGETMPDPRIF